MAHRVSLLGLMLCCVGCVPASQGAVTSTASTGSDTTDRSPIAAEGSVEGPETGNALDSPPATASRPNESQVATGTTGTVVETPAETVPVTPVRPTTILAPARSGRVRLSDVHEVIRNHRPEVTGCYQEGLARDRSLAGEAKVRFLIGPRGRIDNVEVYESSLGDVGVEECILATMRDWRFPRPRPRGSSVLLTYPFLLATE